MASDPLATLLRVVLLALVTLGITALTAHMVRRPRIHRRHPARRLLPRWLTLFAIAFLLLGTFLAVGGTALLQDPAATAEDRSDGLGMTLAGIAMVLGGLFFQWMRIIVHLESRADAFVHRGVLGRTTEIPYADITHVDTAHERGAVRVKVTSRQDTSFTAAHAMFDWEPFTRWRDRPGRGQDCRTPARHT
ncbi:MAG: hypothetical protein ACTH1T_18030 [Brachybacterium tyrofermentans]